MDASRMGELSGCCRGSKTRENGRFMDAKGMKRRTHPFRGQKNDARTQRERLRRQRDVAAPVQRDRLLGGQVADVEQK